MNRHEQKKHFEDLAGWLLEKIRTDAPREGLLRLREELIRTHRKAAGACLLCGGTSGELIDNRHAVCSALDDLGVDTPSLGDRCPDCSGAGCKPRSAVGPIDASQATIEAWARPCEACKGSGAINVEDPNFRRSIEKKWRAQQARIRR